MRCVLQFIPDCPGGYVCDVNNFCVAKPCGSQKDCKSNQGCVHGMCQDIECRWKYHKKFAIHVEMIKVLSLLSIKRSIKTVFIFSTNADCRGSQQCVGNG